CSTAWRCRSSNMCSWRTLRQSEIQRALSRRKVRSRWRAARRQAQRWKGRKRRSRREPMSLIDSKIALSKATKELFLRWEEVKTVWTDAQAREFEKHYLFEIEQQVRSAMGALDHMSQVLIAVEHDCE